ncbi:MAG: hypothetical protein CMF23_11805 [Ignavibacteriae bacterium]|nr:hypothetical protein [Ignavibacteriota bacterium]
MIITRLYNDEKGESHFTDIEVEIFDSGNIGKLSEKFPVNEIIFRETSGDYYYDFHNAPQRQFIILLEGEIQIETSLGEVRNFKAGEVLLVEDTEGKGHKTKSVDGKLRRSIFVTLGDNDVKIE